MLKVICLTLSLFALATIILTTAFANAQTRPPKTAPSKATTQQIQPDVINTTSKVAQQDIGSITVKNTQCGKITIAVAIDPDWQLMPASNKTTYKVYSSYTNSDIQHSNDPIITIDWPENTTFKIYVEARSRQNGINFVTMYRKVDEVTGWVEGCPQYGSAPGEVHLRHEQTGKCMFGDPNDGGAVKTFTCWNDPNMIYVLEPISGDEVRLRHTRTGKCVYGNAVNGGIARNWVCWDDPNMVFVKEPLSGNNRFRLRHKATGRCIYGGNSEGAPVKSWGPCWDDPAMVWVD